MDPRELKIAAARQALDYVEDGMKLGIGTGSTADELIRLLAEKVKDGLKITGVPTSIRTEKLCTELGIKLYTLEECPELDLTIDGTDEVDDQLQLIKGGGGAHLREKIVAMASNDLIVMADDSKYVKNLGAFPLPIEVVPFGLNATHLSIEKMAKELGLEGPIQLRKNKDGSPLITDGGHFLLDASFGLIPDAKTLSEQLNMIPGVVENGLFINIASKAILAGRDGIRTITK